MQALPLGRALAFAESYARDYQPYKGGDWCYEDGCLYRGLALLDETWPEGPWWGHLTRLIGPQVDADGGLAGYDAASFNLDNILPGRVLLPLAARGGDGRFSIAAAALVQQLDHQPRIAAGNYWHKRRYRDQLWLDGLYMALPFQVEQALAQGRVGPVADALAQCATALALTDRGAGLFAHGHDAARLQPWADPVTGCSASIWARAMGWLAMALVDLLAVLPPDLASPPLQARLRGLLDRLAALQGADGLWLQVLDQPDLPGNYSESSASAMFAYAILRARRAGLLAPDRAAPLAAVALRALQALTGPQLRPDGPGSAPALQQICKVAGLGDFGGKSRDGSPAYYLREEVVSNDIKGVGPLMMALAEAGRPGAFDPA